MLKEATRTAEFLVAEANGDRSRDQITIAYSKDLPPGTVLGKITTGGKFKQFDPDATDGSETAAGVLYDWAEASAGDVRGVGVVRDAVVVRGALAFASGVSQGDQDAAIDALAERGIVAR